jgi:transposase
VPVTSLATNASDEPDNSDAGVLWTCWCILLATIHQLRQQVIDLRCQAKYWQAQHQRAVQREADLKQEQQHLQAEIRELKRRLFGRKSETTNSADPKSQAAPPGDQPGDQPDGPAGQRRRRGQQAGANGHGRRRHDHLPAEDEFCSLPEHERCCQYCHEPFTQIPGTADGDILEVEVRPHRRRYHRQRYRRH